MLHVEVMRRFSADIARFGLENGVTATRSAAHVHGVPHEMETALVDGSVVISTVSNIGKPESVRIAMILS
jgi:hypothetical protein